MQDWTLDALLEHETYAQPLMISDVDAKTLSVHLSMMVRIRAAERKLADNRRDGVIGGPVHLGVGQEAIAAGVSVNLRNTDRVFGAHRSHSHVLALGASLHPFFAEVLGKDTGLSRGMGGSMHLQDKENGFYGSVPIVAGTVPLATGAALAAKMDGKGDVAVAYLGDGAVEEGVVQESLNLASSLNLPIIFIVENNLFASHMHISLRQTQGATSRFASANGIDWQLVDGNDVLAVSNAMAQLTAHARTSGQPGFLEAATYRWLGHVDWRDDIDVGVSRSEDDIKAWKQRDPIRRLNDAMVVAGLHAQDALSHIEQAQQEEVDAAWAQALADPYPGPDAILGRVYASGNRT